MTACAYCGRRLDTADFEVRHGKFACRDVEACDARDAGRDRDECAELRLRQRRGESLTAAERARIAR